jgi:dolichol-phosphate mannosyltransferase
MDLSIVLPAYQEAENLKLLLPQITSVVKSITSRYEILIVDTTAPMDDVAQVAEANGATLVRRGPTNSYGDAVRTGIRHSTGRRVVFMDADGSHSPEFIQQLVQNADNHDVVIASRYVPGGRTENTLPLVLMSRFLNVVYSVVLGIACKDVSNSFKLYDGERLRRLSLRCDNFDIVEEILVRLKQDGAPLRIKELPFAFLKRAKGKTKRNLVWFMMTYFVTLLRLRFSTAPSRRAGENITTAQ